jgi:hypothetical protein
MPLVSGRSPAREAALWAFGLHALAVLWVALRWGGGVRGGLVFWMDFPLSLAYAGLPGRLFLAASLVLGGAWWAAIAGGLTVAVGRVVRGR